MIVPRKKKKFITNRRKGVKKVSLIEAHTIALSTLAYIEKGLEKDRKEEAEQTLYDEAALDVADLFEKESKV